MKIGFCKIILKQDSIAVYASKQLAEKLTNMKEGQLIEKGILVQRESGKWTIVRTKEDAINPAMNFTEQSYIDVDKKIYYTF